MTQRETAIGTLIDDESGADESGAEVAASPADIADPVARAELALERLAPEFDTWMASECERLDAARQVVHERGLTASACDGLFRASHDIKGEAATFGYPLVAAVAESLCQLLASARDKAHIPLTLIDRHVDAARALTGERPIHDTDDIAGRTTRDLARATAEFLIAEDIAALAAFDQVPSPPLVP